MMTKRIIADDCTGGKEGAAVHQFVQYNEAQ
jgi:hypothetical protein